MRQLSELKAFNQALAYTFEPEGVDGVKMDTATLLLYGQYEDVLDAYLYAQDELLPSLKNKGIESITPELIVDSIKQLNKRFSHSLCKAHESLVAGEFTQSLVIHWHHGASIKLELSNYFLGRSSDYKTEQQFISYLTKEYPLLAKKDLIEFVHLMQKMISEEKRPIDTSYEKFTHFTGMVGQVIRGFARLATAWHDNLLTNDERILVAKFASFIPYHRHIEPSMLSFAKEMLSTWKSINSKDLNAFSLFLADSYQQLVTIHPFANANKRTARCWMNVMLHCSSYPDILLKKREQESFTMEHSWAVSILAQDIRDGIAQAKAPKSMSSDHKILNELYLVALEFLRTIREILSINPEFSLVSLTDNVIQNNFLLRLMDHNALSTKLFAQQLFLAAAGEALKALEKAIKTNSNNKPAVNSSLQPGFFSTEKPSATQVKSKLNEITGLDTWKCKEDLSAIWIGFKGRDEANSLLQTIEEMHFCKPELKTRADKTGFVIMLESVDFKKMSALSATTAQPYTTPS